MTVSVAVDLGAESGRVVVGDLRGDTPAIREVSRFPTCPIRAGGHLRWDVPHIFEHIERGLAAAAAVAPIDSVGVDSWGVDFGLLDAKDRLIELPVAYRDGRTDGMLDRLAETIPLGDVYARTGIQMMPINTLVQLFAMVRSGSPALARARRILTMPDLFHRLLSGRSASERTNASTTQLAIPGGGAWDRDLIRRIGVDPALFGEIVEPGTTLGPLRSRAAAGIGSPTVIAPATHDTACAVAAAPGAGKDWAFLSSGTWSLLGIECRSPRLSEAAHGMNVTNEAGIDGTYRVLRNVMGLWIVQRCRTDLGANLEYDELTAAAESATPFRSLVNPDDLRFLNPPSMPEAIAGFCRETGQPVPETIGGFVRCALESLALRYRTVIDDLARLTGRELGTIHVIGGGAQNTLLNRMTADATGRTVVAGPVEAAAIGNIFVQARTLGRIATVAEGREMIRRSFPPEICEPGDNGPWEEARERIADWEDGP